MVRGCRAEADAWGNPRSVAADAQANSSTSTSTSMSLRRTRSRRDGDRLKLAVDGIPVKPRARRSASTAWAGVRVDRVDTRTVGAWRKRLPEGSAWHAHKALRQVLSYAVLAKLSVRERRDGSSRTRSRSGGRCQRSSLGGVDRLAVRTASRRGRRCRSSLRAPGLRPEEWLALEWRDIDLKAGVLHVRRVYTDGRVKDYGKQDRSRRRLPLRSRAVDALRASPQGFGSSVRLSGPTAGGYLNLHAWRRDEWKTCARVVRAPLPRSVLDAAHVRVVRDRCRRQPLLPRAVDGLERRADRLARMATCSRNRRSTCAGSSTRLTLHNLTKRRRQKNGDSEFVPKSLVLSQDSAISRHEVRKTIAARVKKVRASS